MHAIWPERNSLHHRSRSMQSTIMKKWKWHRKSYNLETFRLKKAGDKLGVKKSTQHDRVTGKVDILCPQWQKTCLEPRNSTTTKRIVNNVIQLAEKGLGFLISYYQELAFFAKKPPEVELFYKKPNPPETSGMVLNIDTQKPVWGNQKKISTVRVRKLNG